MSSDETDAEISTCVCGAVEVITIGAKFDNLRCWQCPPKEPRPVLRLVKT